MPQFKLSSAALLFALISNKTVSIKTGFNQFGITNVPREIGRSVERKFGVKVDKKRIDYKTQYGIHGYYYEYRLNKSKQNRDNVKKIYDFISKNMTCGSIQREIY